MSLGLNLYCTCGDVQFLGSGLIESDPSFYMLHSDPDQVFLQSKLEKLMPRLSVYFHNKMPIGTVPVSLLNHDEGLVSFRRSLQPSKPSIRLVFLFWWSFFLYRIQVYRLPHTPPPPFVYKTIKRPKSDRIGICDPFSSSFFNLFFFSIIWLLLWPIFQFFVLPVPFGSGSRCGSFYFHHWPSRCQQKTIFFK